MTNNKLVPSDLNITNLGQIFAQSGYFQDARDAAQAVVKILAGQELGLPPIASMTGINIIKGKVSLSAVAMATVLKKSGIYDYKVNKNTNTEVEIEFFSNGESIGISEFTVEDATRAGLFNSQPNYKKYPRNMLFARAMSNGIRWYCPDVLGGPAYTPGELEAGSDSGEWVEGEIVENGMSQQVDDFAEWLESEAERKAEWLKTQVKVLELANDLEGVIPIKAAKILEQIGGEWTHKDVVEMLSA